MKRTYREFRDALTTRLMFESPALASVTVADVTTMIDLAVTVLRDLDEAREKLTTERTANLFGSLALREAQASVALDHDEEREEAWRQALRRHLLREAQASVALDRDPRGQTLVACDECGRGIVPGDDCIYCRKEPAV